MVGMFSNIFGGDDTGPEGQGGAMMPASSVDGGSDDGGHGGQTQQDFSQTSADDGSSSTGDSGSGGADAGPPASFQPDLEPQGGSDDASF